MTERYCIECDHHAVGSDGGHFCKKSIGNQARYLEHLVDASPINETTRYATCFATRANETECGRAAYWFESIEHMS